MEQALKAKGRKQDEDWATARMTRKKMEQKGHKGARAKGEDKVRGEDEGADGAGADRGNEAKRPPPFSISTLAFGWSKTACCRAKT